MNIDGINSSNLGSMKPLEGTEIKEKEESEQELFAPTNEEVEVILGEAVDGLDPEKLNAINHKIKDFLGINEDEGFIQVNINTLVEDLKNFDTEEAHVYAEGEAAIEKEVQKRMLIKMSVAAIALNPEIEKEIEAKVRAEYALEHPEYAAVWAEGQTVEAKYKHAKEEEMSNWEKDNPKPERNAIDFIFGGVFSEARYQMELKKWNDAKAEHEKAFEKDYAQENKNYANLKEAEEAQEKKNKNPLLTGGIFGIIDSVVDKDL